MREIEVSKITDVVAQMCIDANLELSPEMVDCIGKAKESERGELAKQMRLDRMFIFLVVV